jgi:hypothetical protein
VHARARQPHTGACAILRRVEHRDLANAGPTQRERKHASGLPATDDDDIVIDPVTVGHPILRIGSDQSDGFAGSAVGIGASA